MKKKELHSGLLIQVLVLLLVIPALMFLGRVEPKTKAAISSMALPKPSGGYGSQAGNDSLSDPETALASPDDAPGGPILAITSDKNPFTRFTLEILRAEGLNEFAAEEISTVTSTLLSRHDVVIMGEMDLDQNQGNMFTNWVNQGGTLICFRPCKNLLNLLGLSPSIGEINDKYLMVHDSSGPGQGIVHETIQFHGAAGLFPLNGATSLATLYANSIDPIPYPAVTIQSVGTQGGQAVAFTYDLNKSIVYTRQGNPAWAGQKRDGQIDPIRSDDLFYPDWIDFAKIQIPQADEQQRLLANIILSANLHRYPMPRFWYLPRDLRAAIVMTGDNHATNGTTERFYQYMSLGPNAAQDVADWKAIRATSYIYPNLPITPAQANFFQQQGFEIALHTNTGCSDYTPGSLKHDFYEELKRFAINYPGVAQPATNRSHCLNWSDWSSTPKVESENGIRLDATYYYWPEAWMKNRTGMFTGSGMPMRFADRDGSLIDVYQVPTQMTDETNMDYAAFCNSLLDRAIGPEGYYGVFCANMHTDHPNSEGSDAIIASAQARGIPIISARQLLNWLDGRNNSSFSKIKWENDQLSFSITMHEGARNLRAMLPLYSENGRLNSISCNNQKLPFTIDHIKGIAYAFFSPVEGSARYEAGYLTSHRETRTKNQKRSEQPSSIANAGRDFFLNILPNPGLSYFNIVTSSSVTDPLSVRVRDLRGRILENYAQLPSTGILRLGQKWKNGTYLLDISQGEQHKTETLVKLN